MLVVKRLLTIGEIASKLGVPVHRVGYVIRTRAIAPAGRAGIARVFSDSDLSQIESELNRIESDREGSAW